MPKISMNSQTEYRRFLYLFFILSLFNSCEKDPFPYKINNLNGNTISLFGHGGMGEAFKFPMNSYESVEPCIRIGADGSEIDVQLTSDSVLVAFHNEKLDQWANCAGTINDKRWSEIDGCKFSSPFSSQIYIMSVESILNRLNNREKYVFTLDCKLYTNNSNYSSYLNQFANAIERLAQKFNMADRLLIESSNFELLALLKQKDLKKLFILSSLSDKDIAAADSLDLFGISVSNKIATQEQVEKAHSKNIRVTFWDVTTEAENTKAIQKSPDYIQSDKIIELLKTFGKYKK